MDSSPKILIVDLKIDLLFEALFLHLKSDIRLWPSLLLKILQAAPTKKGAR